MSQARVRMFAGPNGSGKTTLLRKLSVEHFMPLGFNLNPDDIDLALQSNRFTFGVWGLSVDDAQLRAFCLSHPLASKIDVDQVRVDGNGSLSAGEHRPGYLAAVLADLLRQRWLASHQSFTFETVMSSEDKVDLLARAREAGYRTYTYFVCTDRPEINVERVAIRVKKGGHHVPSEKVIARHARSIELLPRAIAASSRAYLFDNSDEPFLPVAEFEEGQVVSLARDSDLPRWFRRAVIDHLP